MNVRSLSPNQLRVLLALDRLGCATAAEIITAARCDTDGETAQALRALVSRELAVSGSFGEGQYGYQLTEAGRDCAKHAA